MGKRKGNAGRKKMTDAQKLAAMLERSRPNPKVIARQDRFRHFRGDGSLGLEMTCAGRLMLVGAFDGMEVGPEELLNALLTYSNAYWGNYSATGTQVSDYRREVKGGNDNDEEDRRGKWFEAYDQLLRDCGHATRRAVHEISVDRHWFPDDDADWAERIINSACLAKREALRQTGKPVPPSLTVEGALAVDSDFAMLELARHGALALALGKQFRKAA